MSRRGKIHIVIYFLIMKKTYLVLLLATLTLSACGAAKTDTGTTKNEETPKTESAKSLKELLGLGTSQKCTFESKTDDTTVKSEIIMSGKKFKQTTTMTNLTDTSGTTKVYAVSDGVYYYSWGDSMRGNGTKMKIEDVESKSQNIPADDKPITAEGNQEVNMDQKIDYKCSPATLNDSDLTLPTDVKFVDYSEMIKEFQKLVPSQGE
jgi:hypothetical protein